METMKLRDDVDTIAMASFPGAGKGTLSKELNAVMPDLQSFEVGGLVRTLLKQNRKFARIAREYAERGLMVPDDVILPHVEAALEELPLDKPWLLDGIPRTPSQIGPFTDMMRRLGRKEVMVYLDLGTPEDSSRIAEERIQHRLEAMQREGITPRKDDADPVARAQRLATARSDIPALVGHYERLESLVRIDALQSVEGVCQEVRKKLLLPVGAQLRQAV